MVNPFAAATAAMELTPLLPDVWQRADVAEPLPA